MRVHLFSLHPQDFHDPQILEIIIPILDPGLLQLIDLEFQLHLENREVETEVILTREIVQDPFQGVKILAKQVTLIKHQAIQYLYVIGVNYPGISRPIVGVGWDTALGVDRLHTDLHNAHIQIEEETQIIDHHTTVALSPLEVITIDGQLLIIINLLQIVIGVQPQSIHLLINQIQW